MNDQSQIEAKIIHLTPPQRFQVAHQLPKDHPAEQSPIDPTLKSEEYKVVTTNHSKIWAIRILNGTWLLVTLFLKRCTRIDKNLLVVYVALVLLLLQVFMVIARAEAGSLNSPPLMTSPSNLSADWQHTRIAQTYPNHFISNATLPVQAIDRSSVTLAKNPPWQLRLADTCPGTHVKAAGAAAALFAYFFQLQGKSMTRGSETNIIAVSYPNPPELAHKEMRFNHSMNSLWVNRQRLAYPPLSGTGVPQMITSIGS